MMVPTAKEAEQGLRAVYSHDKRPERSVADVSLLGSGFETDVFVFSLREAGDRAEQQNYILRLYAGEDTAAKAAREFAVMRSLHNIGYPVPGVQMIGTADSPFGRPFLIMEYIPGESMGAAYWSKSENPPIKLQGTLMHLMHRLHQLKPTTILPESPLANVSAPHAGVASELASLTELLERLEGREPASLRKVFVWLVSRLTTVSEDRLSVIHGDFHPNNV